MTKVNKIELTMGETELTIEWVAKTEAIEFSFSQENGALTFSGPCRSWEQVAGFMLRYIGEEYRTDVFYAAMQIFATHCLH